MPRVKTEVEIEVEVWCDTCGKDMSSITQLEGTTLYVPSCPSCINEAQEGGYNAGYNKGVKEGYHEGYDRGVEDG